LELIGHTVRVVTIVKVPTPKERAMKKSSTSVKKLGKARRPKPLSQTELEQILGGAGNAAIDF
jgi:hypothetical protein